MFCLKYRGFEFYFSNDDIAKTAMEGTCEKLHLLSDAVFYGGKFIKNRFLGVEGANEIFDFFGIKVTSLDDVECLRELKKRIAFL
jgi:hypothetical protein